MKRYVRWLIVGLLLIYCGSYLVWSRLALAEGAAHGSRGFYFFSLTKWGAQSDFEFPVMLFYYPCIILDGCIFEHTYSSAPLSDLS